MYFQDIHTNEILKLKGDWQEINGQLMAYFQTELGALITMCESDLRKIYTIYDLKEKYSDEHRVEKIYNLQKQLAKRGARIEMFILESDDKVLYNWIKENGNLSELEVIDFDIESETVMVKGYKFPISFDLIHDVIHLDMQRFVVDEVVEVINKLGFDHKNKCIEHSERITLNESILTRTIFIRDNKTRNTIFEIKNAEKLDDTELYDMLIEKIKEFSSKAVLNI